MMKLILLVTCSLFIVPIILCGCSEEAPTDISSMPMRTFERDTFSVVIPESWEIYDTIAPDYFLALSRTDTGRESASVEIQGGNNVTPGTDVEAIVQETLERLTSMFNTTSHEISLNGLKGHQIDWFYIKDMNINNLLVIVYTDAHIFNISLVYRNEADIPVLEYILGSFNILQ